MRDVRENPPSGLFKSRYRQAVKYGYKIKCRYNSSSTNGYSVYPKNMVRRVRRKSSLPKGFLQKFLRVFDQNSRILVPCRDEDQSIEATYLGDHQQYYDNVVAAMGTQVVKPEFGLIEVKNNVPDGLLGPVCRSVSGLPIDFDPELN